jgi:hypothetical protein
MAITPVALSDGWAERRLGICARDLAQLPSHARRLVPHLATAGAARGRPDPAGGDVRRPAQGCAEARLPDFRISAPARAAKAGLMDDIITTRPPFAQQKEGRVGSLSDSASGRLQSSHHPVEMRRISA